MLCYEAKQLPEAERKTYLAEACAGEKDLLKEVKSLLEQMDSNWLQQPLVEVKSSFVFSDDESVADARIGSYRLIRVIASGGMGQVFLAVRDDDQFEQFVALKVLRKGLLSQKAFARFIEERQILASLNHPNIACLYDGGTTEDGIPWFAMEYVEGQSVTDYCRMLGLTVAEKNNLFLKVCSAVQNAHQNLVIHRDLKPANILITRTGVPKLLDFGIAKHLALDVQPRETLYQDRVMTPEYASPEQVKHEPVSTVSDVYSLGVLLYEMLTGSLPYHFIKRSPAAIEKTICNTIPPLPSTITGNKELCGDLDSVIMKALKKNPGERYPSVDRLSDDLLRYQQSLPISARKDSLFYHSRKFLSRHRWGTSVVACVALIIIIFTTITFIQSKEIQARANETEQQRDRAEQVNTFLTDLFESVDPSEARDNALSAIELLNRGAERVETELMGQPQEQANLYLVISDVYESLGMYDEGLDLAWKADSIQQKLNSDDHAEVARILNTLGWLYRQTGDYERADSLLTKGLMMRRELYGNSHLDVARSLNDLAVLKQTKGDYAATDTLLSEAIEIRRALNTENEALGIALSNQAALKYGLGDFTSAEQQMREALTIFQTSVGNLDMRTANVMTNLAAILTVREKMDEAITYYRDALDIRLQLLGEDHPDIASSYAHLGNILRGYQMYDESETMLLKAYDLRRELFGNNHALTNDSKRVLGILYQDMGEETKAEEYYAEALEAFRSIYPNPHAETAEVLQRLGNLYLNAHKPLKAEQLLREALAMRREIFGEENGATAESMIKLGFCLHLLGDDSQAKPFILSGLEVLSRTDNNLSQLKSEAEAVLSVM